MANLVFWYATMNSGKSLDLLRAAHNYEEEEFKVLVMKPIIDTKGGDKVTSRLGLKRKVDFLIDKDASIPDILRGHVGDISAIFVDEAQFLTPKQVVQLYELAHALDIDIHCYGLRSNFKMKTFEGSAALLEIADELKELTKKCNCGKEARYVGRKVNGVYQTDGDVVVIDGAENVEYVPLCGDCYLEEVRKVNFDSVRKYMLLPRKPRKE